MRCRGGAWDRWCRAREVPSRAAHFLRWAAPEGAADFLEEHSDQVDLAIDTATKPALDEFARFDFRRRRMT
jgi:hypothetical protein